MEYLFLGNSASLRHSVAAAGKKLPLLIALLLTGTLCAAQGSSAPGEAAGKKSSAQAYLDFVLEEKADSAAAAESEPLVENPDAADADGMTALMKAAKEGNDWEIQCLVRSGADLQKRDKDGWSALMYAVRYQNDSRVVRQLVSAGAHTRVRNKYNSTPLLLAAYYSPNPDILSLLLENRSSSEDEVFNAFILSLTSPAGTAQAKLAKIRQFLAKGIPVNRLWQGMTPLMYACRYATSTQPIAELLKNGADVSPQDRDGRKAFDYAMENPELARDGTFWQLNATH